MGETHQAAAGRQGSSGDDDIRDECLIHTLQRPETEHAVTLMVIGGKEM